MKRRATFFIKEHNDVRYGVRDFHSIEDFVFWKVNIKNKGKEIVSFEWNDGYPGLDAFKKTSWR